jgi:hypothetical protein
VPAVRSAPCDRADRQQSGQAEDLNGSPTGFDSTFQNRWVGGFSRASTLVDNLWTIPAGSTRPRHRPADPSKENDQRTTLRPGSETNSGPDWAIIIPTSGFTMLIAADWLRRRLPVFASCIRKLVRHLCKPYWSAGWCNRDIVHAMDHRPGLFGQPAGVLLCPQRIAVPRAFIRSRLTAWRSSEGAILPGHWSTLLTDAAAATTARRLVATHHGRAGAALLRLGERALTAQRIADHGRAARPPASPTTRAAAQATLGAALTDRGRRRASSAGTGDTTRRSG